MFPHLKGASILVAIFAVAGCTTPPAKVRVDQAESGLPNCQTFAWHNISGDATSLTDQRVRAAVMGQLNAKGYTENVDKPDCRIAYRLATREIPKAKPGVGVGMGGGSGGMHGGVGISIPIGHKSGHLGTFTVDVIDAGKNAQVWSGSIDADLDQAEMSDEEAQSLVTAVLAQYPNRK